MASLLTVLTFIFLLWIVPIIITYRVSKRKNRNYRLWTFWSILFGWFVAIISLLLTKLDKQVNY